MDQATAKKLFEEGAIFIFLDVPEGTEFGIDMKSWNTGEKFRGVKMIPPGLHYIFYSSVGDSGEDVAPRSGFFYNFRGTEIVARKWDKQTETISREPVPDAQIVSLRENILALDGFLGPYPYDIWEKWISLTSNITDNLLIKLTPGCGEIHAALELQSCSDADRPRGGQIKAEDNQASPIKKSRLSGEELLPNLKPVAGTELRLTPFPIRNYPEGANPSEITTHSLDSTYVLETMLDKYLLPKELIGEMEFCFVCFLVGHCLDAFEQWKKLVTLLCSCDTAIKKYRLLYINFLTVLEVHITEIPEEFLADIVSNNNFVYVNLRNLFRTVQCGDGDSQLKNKAEDLRKNLSRTYGWDFDHLDSEDEDEAPVIVDISDS